MKSKYVRAIAIILVAAWIFNMSSAIAFAASKIYFCSEFSCADIAVMLGNQTHPSRLNCSNLLSFTGVPQGSYAYSATGCGSKISGTITVNGIDDYLVWFCPGEGQSACPTGCGSDGAFRCSITPPPPPPPTESGPCEEGFSPVYRFFNTATGTHFFTISGEEKDSIINSLPQFSYEGTAWCAKLPK